MYCITMSGFKFSYRGMDFCLYPRDSLSVHYCKVGFSYRGVRSAVYVGLPFDTSSRSALEYLWRKCMKSYFEIKDNLSFFRSRGCSSNDIYSL